MREERARALTHTHKSNERKCEISTRNDLITETRIERKHTAERA